MSIWSTCIVTLAGGMLRSHLVPPGAVGATLSISRPAGCTDIRIGMSILV